MIPKYHILSVGNFLFVMNAIISNELRVDEVIVKIPLVVRFGIKRNTNYILCFGRFNLASQDLSKEPIHSAFLLVDINCNRAFIASKECQFS